MKRMITIYLIFSFFLLSSCGKEYILPNATVVDDSDAQQNITTSQDSNTSHEENVTTVPEETPILPDFQLDFYNDYRAYYGEWIVSEHISGSFGLEYLGTTLIYNYDSFTVGERKYHVKYSLAILPICSETELYYSRFITINELGMNNHTFIIDITLFAYDGEHWSYVSEFGASFCLLDDNTLMIDYSGNLFYATRTSHIEGYEWAYIIP